MWDVGMFPRHVEKCFSADGHMNKDDPWVLNNSRMEVERDIIRKLEGMCEVVNWYELIGADGTLRWSF